MIRLIVSDLDGTLLSAHDTIHPDNLDAIHAAMDRGIPFAVASGRSAVACSILLTDHGLTDAAIIGVNGCQVMERPFGRTLALHFMPEGAAEAAQAIFARYGLKGCLYGEHTITYSDETMMRQQEGVHTPAFFARMEAAGVRIAAGGAALTDALRAPVLKTFCVHRPEQKEAFEAARTACARIPGVAITSSWRDNFEVIPAGIDKGMALRALADQLGVAAADVIAFGDSENDLPMLRWAGHAYAMENGRTVVKHEIGNVTAACTAGGVAQVIDRLLG